MQAWCAVKDCEQLREVDRLFCADHSMFGRGDAVGVGNVQGADGTLRPDPDARWKCTYCNEVNPHENGVGIDNCSRCGTRRSR